MKYDFETVYDRRNDGSRKWECIEKNQAAKKKQVIPMTVADMEFQASPEIKEGLAEYIEKNILGYSNPTTTYLKTVKQYMQDEYDWAIATDWVVTTPGVVSALSTSVRAFTDIGDGVIVFSPVYYPFYEVIESQKRQVLSCDLDVRNMRYEINFKRLEELAANEQTKMILLCSPHNPGGRVWTKEELEKIAAIAAAHDLVVISDEIHADLTFDGVTHTVYSTLSKEAKNHSVICTSASKMYNIAGLQCSNILIANEQLRDKFNEEKESAGIQVANVLGMKATEIAYTKAAEWRKEVMAVIAENKDYTIKFLKEADARFNVMEPDASFLVWVNIADFQKSNEEFIQALNDHCQIYITDGLIYGEQGDNWLRFNVGMPKTQLMKTLERIQALPF